MHKITITQQDGWQTTTTKYVVGGAVMSTRAIAYKKMPTPRKKPTGEALEQARARCEHMRQVVQERKRNGA